MYLDSFITRYEIVSDFGQYTILESKDGEWIKYKSVKQEIERLKAVERQYWQMIENAEEEKGEENDSNG